MMSKTAIAMPTSPAQASLTSEPICWRLYLAVTPSAAKPRRYTSDVVAGASFHPYEALATTSLVYRRGFAALGVTAKYNRQQIGSDVSDAWAGDVGMAIAVFDIMAVGVSVQNLGGDLCNGALLPRRTRARVTLNYTDPQGTYRLLPTPQGQGGRGPSAVLIQGVEG